MGVSSSLQKFCAEWLDAWSGNRPELLISFYAQDAFYSDPANRDGLHGHKEILPYLKKLLSYNPLWRWEVVELFSIERGLVLKWRAEIPVREKKIIEEGLDIVEILNFQITRNEVFFDRTNYLKTLNGGRK